MKIGGFDWDAGNWPKCGKHGVSKAEIEQVITKARFMVDDPSPIEPRFLIAGKVDGGRFVFVVFTHREKDGQHLLRPLSARYMHAKEVRSYETQMARIED